MKRNLADDERDDGDDAVDGEVDEVRKIIFIVNRSFLPAAKPAGLCFANVNCCWGSFG